MSAGATKKQHGSQQRQKGNYQNVYSQVLQDILRRLDKAFKSFFGRVKAGEIAPSHDSRARREMWRYQTTGSTEPERRKEAASV